MRGKSISADQNLQLSASGQPLKKCLPMSNSQRTRRNFLSSLLSAPIGLYALAFGGKSASASGTENVLAQSSLSSTSRAEVVVARRDSAVEAVGGKIHAGEVRKLLDAAVTAFGKKGDATAAWKSLFSPADVVGVKVNCLAGRGLSTNPESVAAIVEGLASAGIERQRIIIWDRTEHDLQSAGFSLSGLNGARVLATDSRGVGYEADIEFSGEVGSCFSRIISRMCTAIISVPVLKDHDLAGVSLGMKNFYGAIHNPNKYHDNNCSPFVADLSAHPFIRNKLRLVVCDGLIAQYHGGPAQRPQWAWPAATLLVGTDPVAIDRVGWEMIEEKRKEAGMQPLKEVGREPKYIEAAEKIGLGTADIGKIFKIMI